MVHVQHALGFTQASWRPVPVSELPRWPKTGRIGLDTETRDEQLTELGPGGGRRKDSYTVGFSFAIEDGPAHYVPYRHVGGDNVDPTAALAYLRDQLGQFRGELVGANVPYDEDILLSEGVAIPAEVKRRDVLVGDALINELELEHNLDVVSARLGLLGKDQGDLERAAQEHGLHPKAGLWKLPARFIGRYGEQDARLPLSILRRLEKEFEAQNLWQVWNLECDLIPVLVRMTRRGVRVDFDAIDKIHRWALEEQQNAAKVVTQLTGVKVEAHQAMESALLAKALSAVGIQAPLTEKSKQPSITKELLEKTPHDVAKAILRMRQMDKLQSTYCESMRSYAIGDRIHCTFNQVRIAKPGEDDQEGGARFGRLSSSDPNLQNQPVRHREYGARWRAAFIPDEGLTWCSNDYSSQEPRWTFHYAHLLNLAGAAQIVAKFVADPSTDTHGMMRDIIGWTGKDGRERAKVLFLGLVYGMGGARLCDELDLPTAMLVHQRTGREYRGAGPEGQLIIDQFHRAVPFVRDLARACSKAADERGWIRTALGRVCHFPELGGPNDRGETHDWLHKALNRLIQGSSGDQMKKAMILADAAGHPLQLQVHDELNLSVAEEKQGREVAEIMRDAVPCTVPMLVKSGFGKNWSEAK